jgi:hypothetical protein
MDDFVVLPGANNKNLGVFAYWRFNNNNLGAPGVWVVLSPTPDT